MNANKNRNDCYAELNKEISDVVAKAFFDQNINHKGYVIVFLNGENYRPNFLKKWQNIVLENGDSIYKKAGAFKFVIYKKGYENPIIIEDTVNCDKLK